MLYFIFTVDGDWKEYFDVNLSEDKRRPHLEVMQGLIEEEIKLAVDNLDGKFIHFIHTSPRAHTFFLNQPFIELWRQIIEGGGCIGLHPHEDDPYKNYYFQDFPRMKEVISKEVSTLRSYGLDVYAYRGGFLSFCRELIPILEENGIYFDFSCKPGRYLVENNFVISDWRGAPASAYQMSYNDYRKVGTSKVFEIPLGSSGGKYLYFEKANESSIEEVAISLKKLSEKKSHGIIVSVLVHSWEFASKKEVKELGEKISLLKKYGRFINLEDLLEIIETA